MTVLRYALPVCTCAVTLWSNTDFAFLTELDGKDIPSNSEAYCVYREKCWCLRGWSWRLQASLFCPAALLIKVANQRVRVV